MTDERGSDFIEIENPAASEEHLLEDEELLLEEDEDRTFPERPCGDPAAHDRLLLRLRRYHPEGHDKAEDTGAPMSRARPPRLDTSLTGSSASLCADAA
ncbi:MAG TPA: hypothetical protein VGB82_24105 [Alphaproteobacteria bacterium]